MVNNTDIRNLKQPLNLKLILKKTYILITINQKSCLKPNIDKKQKKILRKTFSSR